MGRAVVQQGLGTRDADSTGRDGRQPEGARTSSVRRITSARAQHFASAQREAGLLDDRRRGEVLDIEDDIGGPRVLAAGKQLIDRTPDHVSDQLRVRDIGDDAAGDASPVTEHGEDVRNPTPSRAADVDDPGLRASILPDQREQMLHVVSLQTAGRLVHEDDPRLRGNRATDLDHLLRGQRQLADEAVRSKVRMGEALKDVEGELLGFAALKEAPSRGFATEQDVLGDREMRAERQLLMDEGDAARLAS